MILEEDVKATTMTARNAQDNIILEQVHGVVGDRGGLMGCKILSIENGHVDKVHRKYDVFEFASSRKWILVQFHTNTAQIKEDPVLDSRNMNLVDNDATNESFGTSPIDDFLHILDYDELVQPQLEAEEHESFTFGTPCATYNTVIKPWHRVLCKDLDLTSISSQRRSSTQRNWLLVIYAILCGDILSLETHSPTSTVKMKLFL